MNIAQRITSRIAEDISATIAQVNAAINLLDEGATVPFIARYRKEVTMGLDDTQLRNLEERLIYLRDMEDRRTAIIKSVEEQGKLTDELKLSLMEADTKTRLEDLYAPYKPKRRTKAQIAREAGIEPLLDSLLENPELSPEVLAKDYFNEEAGFADESSVLEGARNIFLERVAEQADLVGKLRDYVWSNAQLVSTVVEGQENSGSKFKDYFEYTEELKKIPSHRGLALFRGRGEAVLRLKLFIKGQDDLEKFTDMGICDSMVANHFNFTAQGRAADNWLLESARRGWRVKVSTQLETELYIKLRDSAEVEAIRVFGDNLRDLLLAAPAGTRATMGLDPGLRTGVKVVVLDETGKHLEHATIYPHAPKRQWDQSVVILAKLCEQHKVDLISIGNGTASRETDKLAKELIQRYPKLRLTSIVVSEAGASVYSASELAAKEFPDLDVSIRGAVSIARRLQDPLAELVKIEPKAIGVGQYQHDVNQYQLARKLDTIIEDCVNAVGVEINTASAPLLTKVSGLSDTLANSIVAYREQHGAFKSRQQLLNVPRLGAKAFEQAAGFLRIQNSDNPLDASAVHPEAYPVVENIIKKNNKTITGIIGDSKFLKTLAANDYTDANFGEFTVRDIISELDKPGRDPRPEFKTAEFKEGVETIKDLKPEMILEGVITNVTNFGVFVDIGVHQDGLVHISAITNKFIKDPREVVKTGEVVKVKVMQVDAARNRIGLSMRLDDEVERHVEKDANKATQHKSSITKNQNQNQSQKKKRGQNNTTAEQPITAMAAAFAKMKK
ncbi:MAG: RNA-binding transcriptional accessory protein [Gammaproteobacteria bacterium]|nr:RNA-binding transcriptional accessory protein [Gammaproteobacteria bacterium]